MRAVKQVMIADDDPGIMEAITMMIEFIGYEVVTTKDCAVLFDAASELPDLLLLDIWMSGVDGRDVCRRLKADVRTKHLPVIMLSASRDIQQTALESGADDFLAKPFEMDELIAKLQQW